MGYNTSIKQLSSSCLVNCLGDCRVLPRVIAERRWRALCFSRQRLSGIISQTVFFYSFLQVYKPILSPENAKVNSFSLLGKTLGGQNPEKPRFHAGLRHFFKFLLSLQYQVKEKGTKNPPYKGVFRSCGSDPPGALAVWQRVQVSLAPSGGQCVALTPSRDG